MAGTIFKSMSRACVVVFSRVGFWPLSLCSVTVINLKKYKIQERIHFLDTCETQLQCNLNDLLS